MFPSGRVVLLPLRVVYGCKPAKIPPVVEGVWVYTKRFLRLLLELTKS
jgi:hypothetical protein